MSDTIDKLNALASQTPSKWRENAQWRKDNAYWTKTAASISIKLICHLRDNDIDIDALSRGTNISVDNLNQMCKGDYDFSIKELCALQDFLKIKLVWIN